MQGGNASGLGYVTCVIPIVNQNLPALKLSNNAEIMEKMHLSRDTYFRRVIELNKMSRQEIATRFGSELVTEILVIKYGSYNAISNSYKIFKRYFL